MIFGNNSGVQVKANLRNLSILTVRFPGSDVVRSSIETEIPETSSREMLEKRAVVSIVRYGTLELIAGVQGDQAEVP